MDITRRVALVQRRRDCNRVAAEVLDPEATRVWVVVGDRSALEDQLADLEPIWIDATSAALSTW